MQSSFHLPQLLHFMQLQCQKQDTDVSAMRVHSGLPFSRVRGWVRPPPAAAHTSAYLRRYLSSATTLRSCPPSASPCQPESLAALVGFHNSVI